MSEPILISIATTLAGKAAGALYDLVRQKFAGRKDAVATLEAVAGTSAGSPEVDALARELAIAEAYDPQFSRQLREQWVAAHIEPTASDGGIANTIGGSVSGNVVQARDIHGGISFGEATS